MWFECQLIHQVTVYKKSTDQSTAFNTQAWLTTAKQFNQETYSFFYVNIYEPDQQTYQHFHNKSRFQEKKN